MFKILTYTNLVSSCRMGASPEGKSEDGWGDMAAKLAEDVQKYLQSASMETSTLVVVLLVTVACGILAGTFLQ